MAELEPTLRMTLRVWWSLEWRSLLMAIGFGLCFGVVLGLVAHFMGVDMQKIRPLTVIGGLLIGVGAKIYVVRGMLTRDFGRYRIAVLDSRD